MSEKTHQYIGHAATILVEFATLGMDIYSVQASHAAKAYILKQFELQTETKRLNLLHLAH